MSQPNYRDKNLLIDDLHMLCVTYIPCLQNQIFRQRLQAHVPLKYQCVGWHSSQMQEDNFLKSKKRDHLEVNQCIEYLSMYMGGAALLSIHQKWAK